MEFTAPQVTSTDRARIPAPLGKTPSWSGFEPVSTRCGPDGPWVGPRTGDSYRSRGCAAGRRTLGVLRQFGSGLGFTAELPLVAGSVPCPLAGL